MTRTLFSVASGLLIMLATCTVVWAQATAQISGSVRDQSGAVLPGVGAVTFTGYAPTVTQASSSVSLVPDAGVLTVTGYAPDVLQGTSLVLLGGGPGLPRKRRRDGTESYIERLLGRPLDEVEPEEAQEIEVIEQAAQEAAVAPREPSKADAAESLRKYGVALRDAYVEIFIELERQARQEREDDEIAAIVAAAL